MPIPENWPSGLETQTLVTLGLRAAWLHMHLTGSAAIALAPRDREILTLVATRPMGIAQHELATQMRVRGASGSSGSLRYIDRLIADGWLSRRGSHADAVIDLPAPDREWITSHATRVHPDT